MRTADIATWLVIRARAYANYNSNNNIDNSYLPMYYNIICKLHRGSNTYTHYTMYYNIINDRRSKIIRLHITILTISTADVFEQSYEPMADPLLLSSAAAAVAPR